MFHVLEMLLFIAVTSTYGIYLSYMLVLFGIRIFNIFKYVESMSLISLKLQLACWCIQDNEAHRPTMREILQSCRAFKMSV
jgi:hypothetical protein